MKEYINNKAFGNIYKITSKSKVKYWFWGIIFLMFLIMFLPWTQNIKAKGDITTRYQEQRPYEIQSPIPGKIVKWWVKEGDIVKKGDTIVQLSEIKEEYLDPNLVNRTKEQVVAKRDVIDNYKGKISTADDQIKALQQTKELKIELLNNKILQLKNKIEAEKAELIAATNEYNLAKDQNDRQQKMYNEGLVSLTQLQQRNVSFQNATAKKITTENKLAQTQQDLVNISVEKNSAIQEYNEKIFKAEGERFQSQSQVSAGIGDVAKLENMVSNYTIRNGMYIITASQDGQIVQAKKSGIGEILKDGEKLVEIIPTHIDYIVEMFVKPVDLPLISIGQKVRFVFDGFPAIVFSGWPEGSYGTFGGKIIAFENNIHKNGLFRVLVSEDSNDRKWPQQLKIGSGAQGIALIKDVPIWYELWRNINGFPPEFYAQEIKK